MKHVFPFAHVSALRKGDMEGGLPICLVTKNLGGIYYVLYVLVSLPFR